jgi:hypothetical protein
MVLGYIGGPLAHARRTVDVYRAAGERAGHPEKLRVGISTHFYAAATAEAAREVYPYYHEYLRPKTPGGRGFLVDPASFEAGTRRGNAIMIGSAEQLVEKILDSRDALGAGPFLRPGRLGRNATRHGRGVRHPVRRRDRAGRPRDLQCRSGAVGMGPCNRRPACVEGDDVIRPVAHRARRQPGPAADVERQVHLADAQPVAGQVKGRAVVIGASARIPAGG